MRFTHPSRGFSGVLGALLLGACLANEAQDAREPLAVMSFNVRYGTAEDGANSWPNRRELAVGVIREAAADLVGLQEALRFQLDEIRAALPEYAELGVGRDDGRAAGEYSPILYRSERFRVDEQGTFWFSETPESAGSIAWGARLPRICTWARLIERTTGRALYIYNLHLDHESQEARERSVALLRERIQARTHRDALIVTGDFNAGEDNPAMLALLEDDREPRLRDSFRLRFPDATEVGTFHGFRGDSSGPKIDAILVSPGWHVEEAGILRTRHDGRYPSDHFPVVATLRFAGRSN